MQYRQKLPGVLIPIWKFQTQNAGGLSNIIARIARDLSLDELPQYPYTLLVAPRPLLPAEHDWMAPPLLTPAEHADWNQILRGGVFGLHFPGCRLLERQSPTYLRTRRTADVLYEDHLASPSVDKKYLDTVVEPYLLGEAHEIQASFEGATSAEDRIGQWFATTVAEMLAAPSDSAPELLRQALRAQADRSADALSSEDRAVQQFVSTVRDLLAGEHDFGRYLHRRGLPEMQAFIRDVRDAVQRRAPENTNVAVPFIDNLIGSSPTHTPTPSEAVSTTGTRFPETTNADRPVVEEPRGAGGTNPPGPVVPFHEFDVREALDLPARRGPHRPRIGGPGFAGIPDAGVAFHHNPDNGQEWGPTTPAAQPPAQAAPGDAPPPDQPGQPDTATEAAPELASELGRALETAENEATEVAADAMPGHTPWQQARSASTSGGSRAPRAELGNDSSGTTGPQSEAVTFSLLSESEARRILSAQRQLDEFERNSGGNRQPGPVPRVIRAGAQPDGNRGVVEDYLANGYVAHGTYHPFGTLVPQYPRRPGETWMGRPIPLAWATSRADRVFYFALCERPTVEGGSCTHYSPDRSEMIVSYSLPAGIHAVLAAPENRGYVLLFRAEMWRKATAQQIYVTDHPLVPEVIVEITPDAWSGPPLTELPVKPAVKREHQPFGYEFDDEEHEFEDSEGVEHKLYTPRSTRAPRLAPCAYGMHVRIPVDPDWTSDVEWQQDAMVLLGDKPPTERRLWLPGTPPPAWPANQADSRGPASGVTGRSAPRSAKAGAQRDTEHRPDGDATQHGTTPARTDTDSAAGGTGHDGASTAFGSQRSDTDDAYAVWLQELSDQGVDIEQTISDLTTVWDFLGNDPKWAFDAGRNYGAVVLFGSPDDGGSAVVTNFVRKQGLSELPVVFSGYDKEAAAADEPQRPWATEAARFGLAAEKLGLNSDRIIKEPDARNTRQNAAYSVALLQEHGHDVESIIVVCNPQHARRVWATIKKQSPVVQHIAIVGASISVDNYIRYGLRSDTHPDPTPHEVVTKILAQVKGLLESPSKGHIVEQEIPRDILAAYRNLTETLGIPAASNLAEHEARESQTSAEVRNETSPHSTETARERIGLHADADPMPSAADRNADVEQNLAFLARHHDHFPVKYTTDPGLVYIPDPGQPPTEILTTGITPRGAGPLTTYRDIDQARRWSTTGRVYVARPEAGFLRADPDRSVQLIGGITGARILGYYHFGHEVPLTLPYGFTTPAEHAGDWIPNDMHSDPAPPPLPTDIPPDKAGQPRPSGAAGTNPPGPVVPFHEFDIREALDLPARRAPRRPRMGGPGFAGLPDGGIAFHHNPDNGQEWGPAASAAAGEDISSSGPASDPIGDQPGDRSTPRVGSGEQTEPDLGEIVEPTDESRRSRVDTELLWVLDDRLLRAKLEAGFPAIATLVDALGAAIRSGRLAAGQRLPSAARFAEHFGLSQATVGLVYKQLKNEQLLVGRHGYGTVVAFTGGRPDSRESEADSTFTVRGVLDSARVRETLEDWSRSAEPEVGTWNVALLVEGLGAAIRSEELLVNWKMPATADLAHALGVSKSTVAKAYQRLRDEGLIAIRHGAGAVVANGDEPQGVGRARTGPTQLLSRAGTGVTEIMTDSDSWTDSIAPESYSNLTLRDLADLTDVQRLLENWSFGEFTAAGLPDFLALADALRDGIIDGKLRPGQLLPSDLDLAEDLGLSVKSVTTAYGLLRDERYVLIRPDIGTVVADSGRWSDDREPGDNLDLGARTVIGVADLVGILPDSYSNTMPETITQRIAIVIESLRAAILDSRIPVGGLLPPADDVAAALGLQSPSVEYAYRLLRDEGRLASEGRAGTPDGVKTWVAIGPDFVEGGQVSSAGLRRLLGDRSLDTAGLAPSGPDLFRALRKAIRSRMLRVGWRLPSTRDLAAELGSSAPTVSRVFGRLRDEGYLTIDSGATTVVSRLGADERPLLGDWAAMKTVIAAGWDSGTSLGERLYTALLAGGGFADSDRLRTVVARAGRKAMAGALVERSRSGRISIARLFVQGKTVEQTAQSLGLSDAVLHDVLRNSLIGLVESLTRSANLMPADTTDSESDADTRAADNPEPPAHPPHEPADGVSHEALADTVFREVLHLVGADQAAHSIAAEAFAQAGEHDPAALVTLARKLAVDHVRHARFRQAMLWEFMGSSIDASNPLVRALAGADRQRWDRGFDALEPHEREYLLLRFWEGLPDVVVADTLHLSGNPRKPAAAAISKLATFLAADRSSTSADSDPPEEDASANPIPGLLPIEEYRFLGGTAGVDMPDDVALAIIERALPSLASAMGGNYNLNIRVGQFMVRFAKSGGDGLDTRVEKEWRVLELLARYGVGGGPRVYVPRVFKLLHGVEMRDGSRIDEVQIQGFVEDAERFADMANAPVEQLVAAIQELHRQMRPIPVGSGDPENRRTSG